MKKILACTLASLLVPSICLAHSGTLLRAFANYLPFLAPILAGLVGGIGHALIRWFGHPRPPKK